MRSDKATSLASLMFDSRTLLLNGVAWVDAANGGGPRKTHFWQRRKAMAVVS